MTVEESTQLLSKEASVNLLADMLKQAEEEKTDLLEALEEISTMADARDANDLARAAIKKAKGA